VAGLAEEAIGIELHSVDAGNARVAVPLAERRGS
jgi:hypothetical protein